MNKLVIWLRKHLQQLFAQQDLQPDSQTFQLNHYRFYIVWIFTLFLLCILIGRAFYVQIIDKEYYENKANSRIVSIITTHAMRGMLLDRQGVPLAISSPVMTVFIDPTFYDEQKRDLEIAKEKYAKNPHDTRSKKTIQQYDGKTFDLKQLEQILKIDLKEFNKNLPYYVAEGKHYIELKKQVSPQDVDSIRKLNIVGVNANREYKRYYPQALPNSQIIGMTDSKNVGIEGLEKQLNDRLTGKDGKSRAMRDKSRHIINNRVIEEVIAGEDIYLSLDSRLQYILYRELARAGEQHKAMYASGVMVDVRTGEILAMNTWPSYNPNDEKSRGDNNGKRNRGAVDQFEPGSAIKPFSMAMGLSTGKYTPNSIINTSPGKINLGGKNWIGDTHNYGALSLTNIIVKSSNVGVAKLALAEPLSTLPTFYRKLGFGSKTSAGFIGEVNGLIKPEKDWNKVTVGTMSYGYGIDVTLLQLAQGYAMLGNKGIKLPLSIYKVNKTPEGEQVIDPTIAEQIVLMMEKVTHKGGTAQQARVSGYRVAGKTGTAHRLREDGKGYEPNRYRSLFAGVAPVSDPRIALVIVVEDPKQGGHYGGAVAAPVFSRVMYETLKLLNIPLDKAESE